MPTVALVGEHFAALASAVMRGQGLPNQPAIILPGDPELASAAELAAMAERALGQIIAHWAGRGTGAER